MGIVYLNGEYLPAADARVSVDDRGFLFADAVYEVTPVYAGAPFVLNRHLDRLARNLQLVSIRYDTAELVEVHAELVARNSLADTEFAMVYVQVSRGVAPRGHAFPEPAVVPTVYAFASALARPSDEEWHAGGSAVTVADQRWARPEIKTTQLLPNVLAQQAAVDAGVSDAIFVRDGIALEGPHANLFAVIDGKLVTAPAGNYILHGITRNLIFELAAQIGIEVVERAYTPVELLAADEVFLSSTVLEIRPLVRIDGNPIGNGQPGVTTRALYKRFVAQTAQSTIGA
jgi:D-alanine transaminase